MPNTAMVSNKSVWSSDSVSQDMHSIFQFTIWYELIPVNNVSCKNDYLIITKMVFFQTLQTCKIEPLNAIP